QWRRWVTFHVDFRQQPTTVIDTVLAALQGAPIANVASDPPPNCVLMELGDSTASYAVRYWLTDLAVDDPTDSAVRTRIFFALQRANIPLAMPATAVFVTEDTKKRRDRKQSEAHRLRFESLARVDVFRPLDDNERDQLADLLVYAPFSRGERITRQGAEAHWLYLVTKGEVSVRVEVDGAEKEVAQLHAGEVFGEMSLLTGENRTASVYALTDVECWRLTREGFQQVLAGRPEVAEPIAALLAERRVRLLAVKENLDAESRGRRLQEEEAHLLKKMRAFFGL
ncbi:MAG TPA: cyclic nucleotide-binding domain-containing protein, partial [Myxococcota bacterium]